MRLDLRWPDDAPVARLLAGIPRRQRAGIIRSIVEAALIPGGWARLVVDNNVQVAVGAPEPTSDVPQRPTSAAAPEPDGMSPTGRASFREALRQFGAELED